ncbi:hypothetical protein F441_01096 [Phytophthora nicotianae CJ01A1]|uniref:Uncharacterized protein n=4 Tax=Phytophthora nicotianae TaxID=4792 RepID=V9FXS0_PHYNI|nr:hypothetical protein F443_01122 [Phytophthora nicotianae P1569]ETO85017.1 hypothetical protein F444_01129 [Phytophthora nicotianae P1976]ETP26075.1 hypothetical protein F441_01096 [Phytophthora nicotianae CJ01A1]
MKRRRLKYNRTLNEAMGGQHPDMGKFVVVLEQESQRYVNALSDIANRRQSTPRRVRARTSLNQEQGSSADESEAASLASVQSMSPTY